MNYKELIAYTLILPVVAPVAMIDACSEKLMDIAASLDKRVVDPYIGFWKIVFKKIDNIQRK